MIPGANILTTALSIIAKQSFSYYQFQSRTPNAIGQDVATYAEPITLTGSVQPVPRTLYQDYGLDFQRNYINVYAKQGFTARSVHIKHAVVKELVSGSRC